MLLTVQQAAERLSVESKTVREWLKSGKLKGSKAGRLWRIREEDIDSFLSPRKTYKGYTIEARPDHLRTGEWMVLVHIVHDFGSHLKVKPFMPKEDVRYGSQAEAIDACFVFGAWLIDNEKVGF